MRSGLIVLTVGETSLEAECWRGRRLLWTAQAEYASPSDLEPAVARLASEAGRGPRPRRLEVRLSKPVVQLRALRDLPPVRPSMLPALVAQQAGRFFRRNGVPLVTDAAWEGGGKRQRSRVSVLAAAVEEPVAQALVEGARAAGLVLESISPMGHNGARRLRLFPTADRERRRQQARISLRRLATAVGCLWVSVAGVHWYRLEAQQRSVAQELASLQAPLAALARVQGGVRDARAALKAIERDSALRWDPVRVLGAVTGALPDSSFLSSFDLDGKGQAVLTGFARHATEVVAALERSPFVSAPHLEGTVGREVIGGREWDRFTVSFGLAGAIAPGLAPKPESGGER